MTFRSGRVALQTTKRGGEEGGGYTWTPSPLVKRFARRIAEASAGQPILDLGCGSGRNAMVFSEEGCSTVCVDKDLDAFASLQRVVRGTELGERFDQMTPMRLNALEDPWPFPDFFFGGIISVHFLNAALLHIFKTSLRPGGLLLVETVPGCGGNYLELPKAGELKAALEDVFDLQHYREKKVGPPGHDSVVVHLLAKRNTR